MKPEIILTACGFHSAEFYAVHGGDINTCYRVRQNAQQYFLKMNDALKYPQLFEKEVNGLRALQQYSGFIVPNVITHGIVQNQQYLLIEWIEQQAPQPITWKNFGHTLALMHRQTQLFFGWECDNYIGSLHQENTPCNNWAEFYTRYRIFPLVKKLVDAAVFTIQEAVAVENFCKRSAHFFPDEPPAFLHGDLWSGNFMSTADGTVALFDPAVYFGHREMDIAMMHLFGGFDEALFNAYNEIYPLQKNWQQRLLSAQLYPLLVHAVLFGGVYVTKVMNIVKKYK